MKKLNKKVPIIGGAVIGVILVIYIILCFLASGKGFIKNMTINGIKVNNMSKEEVISKLEKTAVIWYSHRVVDSKIIEETRGKT